VAALGGATAALYAVSRGKWSDALSDSGREWIVPDAVARGELLYRDVVYWFGPLSPYWHALLFRLFGSNFSTLVLGGGVAAVAALAALRFALGRVTGKNEACLWTALAVPALIFMPSAGGALLGMGYRIWHAAALALAAVAWSAGPGRGFGRGIAIGGVCGLAALCRTEWGLAALVGCGIAAALRERAWSSLPREALAMFLGFGAAFGGTLGLFLAVAGVEAVIADGHLLFTELPEETRRFLWNVSGLNDIPGGILRLAFSAAAWLAAFLLAEIAAVWKHDRDRLRRRLPALAGALLFLLLYRDYAGTPAMIFFSAAPAVGLAAVVVGVRRGPGASGAALAAVGVLSLLLSYRKLFSIGDFPYVAPPLLFALVCLAGLLRQAIVAQRERALRLPLRRALALAPLLLTAFAFAARLDQFLADRRVPVEGTQGMLSVSPVTERRLLDLVEAIRRETAPTDGLVVLPEGELLNFLARRSNPMRHKLYLPGYLSERSEPKILAELDRLRPRAIVVLHRPTGIYGRHLFGQDYGVALRRRIEQSYAERSLGPGDAPGERWARLFLRKAP
jgi:hypothetical protein